MTRRNKSGRSVRGILSGGKKDADGSSLSWRSTLITSSTHMKRCWWSCQNEQVRDAERSGISSSVSKWMEDGYVVRLVMVVWWCYDRWWSTCNDHLGPFDEWWRGGVIISNFVLDRIPGLPSCLQKRAFRCSFLQPARYSFIWHCRVEKEGRGNEGIIIFKGSPV